MQQDIWKAFSWSQNIVNHEWMLGVVLSLHWASLVKHLPAVWKTWVRSLGQEDPLEKETATHSSTLAWKIPWTEEPGGLQSMGLRRVRHNWDFTFFHFGHQKCPRVLGTQNNPCGQTVLQLPWLAKLGLFRYSFSHSCAHSFGNRMIITCSHISFLTMFSVI